VKIVQVHNVSRNVHRGPDWVVLLLWLLFVLHGLFYCLAMPLWEGFDEPYQFAAVQYVARTGHMPTPATPLSRQVAASLYLSPAPWMLRVHALPQPVLSYEQYWSLSPDERASLRAQLLSLPTSWDNEPSNPPIENYEGQQAPLYYFLAAPVFRAFASFTLPGQVIALRLFGLLLASISLPIGYRFAERALGNRILALLILAVVVAMPELFINLCRVSNEPLALLICTLLLLVSVQFVQSERRPLAYSAALGLLLAVALLTKAYFLTFLPAVIFLLWMKLRGSATRLFASLAVVLAIAAAGAGPWYWHVHRISGSWSGQTDDAALRHTSRLALLGQVAHVNWKSGLASILFSHIWFGGWSFLRLSSSTYLLLLVPAAVAAVGIVLCALKWLRSGCHPDAMIAIAFLYVCFWAGLCYHVLVTYVHLGVSASTGWYLYCLVFGEVVLLAQGFLQILGRPALRWVLPSLVMVFSLIDIYGMHSLMLPYYTGRIVHVGDVVRPLQITAFSVSDTFSRLASLGPGWLARGALVATWMAYLLAILMTGAVAWVLGRGVNSRKARPS